MEKESDTVCQISALNDLIRINNDRITGYQKRMSIALDDDLDDLFAQYISQSRQNIEELGRCIRYLGGQPAIGSSLSGKFYHSWMDFKSAPYRQSRQTMLDYCEYGEDVAKSAYQKVLSDRDFLNGNKKVIQLLKDHLEELKASYIFIKKLRDNSASAA